MDAHARRTPRVAIIGAGFSGIAAAVALRRKGIEDFVIFEKAQALGGTWWHNRYPGAEVDLESHIYSFSFERHDWTRTHADWRELLGYLEGVAEKWDLPRRTRFNEAVEDVSWSDDEHTYTVTTSSGIDHGAFTAVISAVGFLNIPVVPPFAREDHDFEGAICHTSRWIDGLDMTGKSVAVVGTGSSAVQVVSEAAKIASDVTIFQLEPNWIVPKDSRDFTRCRTQAQPQPARICVAAVSTVRRLRPSPDPLGPRAQRRSGQQAAPCVGTGFSAPRTRIPARSHRLGDAEVRVRGPQDGVE